MEPNRMPVRNPIQQTVDTIHILPFNRDYKDIVVARVSPSKLSKVLHDISEFEDRVDRAVKNNKKRMTKIFLCDAQDAEKLKIFLESSMHPVRLVIHGEGNPAVIGPSNQGLPEYDLLAHEFATVLSTIIPKEGRDITIDLLTCCSAVTEKITCIENDERHAVKINFAKDLSYYLNNLGLNNITTVGYTGYVGENDSANKYRVSSALICEAKAKRNLRQTSQESAAISYQNGVMLTNNPLVLISGRKFEGEDIDSFRIDAAIHKKIFILQKKAVKLAAENVTAELVVPPEENIQPVAEVSEGSDSDEVTAVVAPEVTADRVTSIIQSTTLAETRVTASPRTLSMR